MDGIEDLLAECKVLLKESKADHPRYVPGVPQIPGRVGYITQIRSSHWPTIDVADPGHSSDHTSAGHNSCATNPDLEALLAKYASVPNVPTARVTNKTDKAFESAFLDRSKSGKFIASFGRDDTHLKQGSRSSSPRVADHKWRDNGVDKFAKAFGSPTEPQLHYDTPDMVPQRIILPESVRVRLTGVSTRSTSCFLTSFRAVKIKSDQSTSNIHDQKSCPKQKSVNLLLPSLAHGKKRVQSDQDVPDKSVAQARSFLDMMLQQCKILKKVTASSGDRKSILKPISRNGSAKKVSRSPPKDVDLGLDQSFVSNSEGLCHSLLLQSKFANPEGIRSKSGSKSRSNSNKRAPWRPNSIVAPIPQPIQPISYIPPAVVLKPEHPLYDSISNLKKDPASMRTPVSTQKRGLIRESQITYPQPAGPRTNPRPQQNSTSSSKWAPSQGTPSTHLPASAHKQTSHPHPRTNQTPTTTNTKNMRANTTREQPNRRDHRFDTGVVKVASVTAVPFEASLLGHEENSGKLAKRTGSHKRVVTFNNSVVRETVVKPKGSLWDAGRSHSVDMQADDSQNDGRCSISTEKAHVSRRSNIQRSFMGFTSVDMGTQGHPRKSSSSAGKLQRDASNLTFRPISEGIGLNKSKSSILNMNEMDHEHLPGQTGCSICVYNFGKNMPYETKHLGKLYAARRDEYQKQVLSNPELATIEPERRRSSSKSLGKKSRSNSKTSTAGRATRPTQSTHSSNRETEAIRFEGTGSSSLERARRLKKEMNHAVQQHRQERDINQEEACLERLGIRGKVSVQQILQKYSTQGYVSNASVDLDNDETPRTSVGLQKAEEVRRSVSPSTGWGSRLSHTSTLEESGVLVKPNGDRYEFHLRKLN